MGGFLRMTVYARTAGDAEFVEALRKELDKTARSRSAQMLLGLAALTIGFAAIIVAVNLFADLTASARNAALAGLVAGAGAGFVLALGYRAIADSAQLPATRRMAELLLKYHDQLASRDLPGEQPPAATDKA